MKKRKLFIGALIAFAIAFLGIGYAATQRTLTVNGTAVATVDFDVKFNGDGRVTGSEGSDVTGTATIDATDTDGRTATVTLSGFKHVNDEATVELTVLNNSTDLTATLAAPVVAAATATAGEGQTVIADYADYFTITATYPEGVTTIAKGATTTLTLKVKLIKAVADDKITAFKVTAVATATEPTA